MTKHYLSEDEIEVIINRIKMISNPIDRTNVIRKIFYSNLPSEEFIIELQQFEEFTSEIFTLHPNLTYSIYKKFEEKFDINIFKEHPENILLLLNDEFARDTGISNEEKKEAISKLRKISDQDLEKVDFTKQPVELIVSAIARTDINRNKILEEKISNFKSVAKDAFLTYEMLKYGRINPTAEEIEKIYRSTVVSIESFLTFVNILKDYPVDIQDYFIFVQEQLRNKNTDPELSQNVNLNSNTLIKDFSTDISVRILSTIQQINPDAYRADICNKFIPAFQTFIVSKNLSEDQAIELYGIMKDVLPYDTIVRYARKNNFEKIMMMLALTDNPGDDYEF